MIHIMYYITRNNELIFATGHTFDTKEEAQKTLADTYEDIKDKINIKDIKLTEKELIFTVTTEGEPDEIHNFIMGGNLK